MHDRYANPMETSCGFVLLNYDSVLLLQYPQGHWSFPKGHVEEGETNHHITAARELAEETGIVDISIDDNWATRTQYTFRRKGATVPKQVYWYIAETSELDVTLSHEHTNYMWLDFEAAEAQLTFDLEKDVLRSAREHLESAGRAL